LEKEQNSNLRAPSHPGPKLERERTIPIFF
jgi:hypothetical protein